MSAVCDRIRLSLEQEFDIPFTVRIETVSGEPEYVLAPEDPDRELFCIRAHIRNGVRLTMDFVPQKYSMNFITAMGLHKEADRQLFCRYVEVMRSKGAVCNILVNSMPISTDDVASWPAVWKKFEAQVKKMPVSYDDNVPEVDIIEEWTGMMMGMILSLTEIVAIEDEKPVLGFKEGASIRYDANRYERNPLNRKLCLDAMGYRCHICGMDFEKIYGEIGHHFIHVHHIIPVSQLGPDYIIDPLHDLVPVCPNCHSMLHKKDPPFFPDELIRIMQRISAGGNEK